MGNCVVHGRHLQPSQKGVEKAPGEEIAGNYAPKETAARSDPTSANPFDQFRGQLYRIFEGTALEGVRTNPGNRRCNAQ
jgi:type IV secretion system protein VirB10